MLNVSKPFGAKAIALPKNQFSRARLRLTLFYVSILAIILFISSSALYSAFSTRLEYRFARFHMQLAPVAPDGFLIPRPDDVRQDLLSSLLLANGLLLAIAGIVSYWLAGLTLEPIEAAYERQRQFLGDASHELRTPLAILRTDLENELADPQLPAADKERSKSHLEEVERMGNIVSNLLTLSRLDEQGVRPEELRDIQLAPVLERAVERLQPIATRNEVTLEIEKIDEHIAVFASENLLMHALSNVINNAILYNITHGTVRISATTDADFAEVRVTDTGMGIAKEDVEKIFERFYRADKSRSRHTGGSGLGLSIVHAIMHRIDGTVDITSEVGKGTIVTLKIPLA
jgi:signal transduction histidine kinase